MTAEENTRVNINLQKAPKPELPKVSVQPQAATPANHPEKISETLLILWNQLLKKMPNVPKIEIPKIKMPSVNLKDKARLAAINILEKFLAKLKDQSKIAK